MVFGSLKALNTVQRQRALALGYTLSEHGLHHVLQGKKGEKVEADFPDERSIFAFLGLNYKAPPERTDGRAVEIRNDEDRRVGNILRDPIATFFKLFRKNCLSCGIHMAQASFVLNVVSEMALGLKPCWDLVQVMPVKNA